MPHGLQKKGFASITEVIVASIIFVLAAAGILSTLSMLRPQGSGSTQKIEAAYLGKGIMDDLRKDVDAATWNNPNSRLAAGVHNLGQSNGYTVSYTVTQLPPPSNARRLDMTITWPDL
ncbi:MAG: hypothetical protein A3C36_06325 [Omnitrophica WOR_2 bacterium RIFCSPHIGHO2_02_FULL_52_10]|nr:MAG: hypothetical protein A3C36_06325 [Omnitrophica WOR_2 bacterium RIFCSPHIGHO2_02_FULL_52_10]